MSNSSLKIGDWVSGLNGIGQVEYISHFYVEEYSRYELRSKNIGDFDKTIVIYKLLCDFDGKIRRRNVWQSGNSSVCTSISKESSKVLAYVKKSNLQDYRNFIDRQLLKPLTNIIEEQFEVPARIAVLINENISALSKELGSEFIYPEFTEKLGGFCRKHDFALDLSDRSYPASGNLTLLFKNTGYRVKNKRAIFTKVEAI